MSVTSVYGLESWPAHDRARLVDMIEIAMSECYVSARFARKEQKRLRGTEENRAAAVDRAIEESARRLLEDLSTTGYLVERP